MTDRGADTPFDEGVRRFNAQDFFGAHECWEEDWLRETDSQRRALLQGLIQVAAGLFKLVEKKDAESATRLLTRGLAKLEAPSPHASAIDLTLFCRTIRDFLATVGTDRAEMPTGLPRLIETVPTT